VYEGGGLWTESGSAWIVAGRALMATDGRAGFRPLIEFGTGPPSRLYIVPTKVLTWLLTMRNGIPLSSRCASVWRS